MTEHSCRICEETFTSETGMRDHTWDVHGACHHCGDPFADRESLYTHWLEAHEAELSQEARKRAERKVGTRTVCPGCADRFASIDAVRDHAWDAHGVCHLCGAQFDTHESLATHWLAVHEADLSRATRNRATSEVDALTFTDRLTHQGPVGAMTGVRVSRRALLGGGAAGLVLGVGGAVANGALGGDGNGRSSTSLAGHPAASALGSQPILGPAPTDADGTIIAFEDPSCPSCARFELGTFPTLEAELVDAGAVSFSYRGIPVVQPWGEPAVLALEATYARDDAAFWALKEFYYSSQGQLDRQNVRSATQEFLTDQTDVDAAAVLDDVEQATHRDAVNADLQASREAGVRGTPTFFLFRGDSFVTKIVGPQPYDVFKNALGL